MKKTFLIALFATIFFAGISTTNAMTEEALKAKLTGTVTVNGKEIALSNDNKVLIDRYLKENDVSEADCDYIASRYDDAVAVLKREGTTDLSKLSTSAKNELKTLVSNVSANTSVKATITDGNITVFNEDGTVFTKTSTKANNVVKQTGVNIGLIAGISFVITIAGAAIIVKQTKKGN